MSGGFLHYNPRFTYHDVLRSGIGAVTVTNVQMDEFYSVVEEICESENDGIALEMLYDAIEVRLRQRTKKMNSYVADNFKAVILRGITSGRISATLEEDVLKRYVANLNLMVTELDATCTSEDDTALPLLSVDTAADPHNDQYIGSMPSDGRLVCYTDDDNGSVVPRWNWDYVPVFAQQNNSQPDSLKTIAESSSEVSIDGGLDSVAETTVDCSNMTGPNLNSISGNFKETSASSSFISCTQDLANPAVSDDNLSVSFVISPNGSAYLSDSDISLSDYISTPITSSDSSTCSEVENPCKSEVAEGIINGVASYELGASSVELHWARIKKELSMAAPMRSSEAALNSLSPISRCGTSSFLPTPAKNIISGTGSACSDDLNQHSCPALKECNQTSVADSSSTNVVQGTFEARMNPSAFMSVEQRPLITSFAQLSSCQDTQSETVKSCSTGVQLSRESRSSNTTSNHVQLKSGARSFAFFNKIKRSEIVTPDMTTTSVRRSISSMDQFTSSNPTDLAGNHDATPTVEPATQSEPIFTPHKPLRSFAFFNKIKRSEIVTPDMTTTSVRRSISSMDQFTSSNPTDLAGNHDATPTVEPATQSEPIFTPHKPSEQDECVDRTATITRSRLPGYMPQWSIHQRLEAKRNCVKEWGHLKNFSRIMFSLWSFERRRPKTHTMGQLFGALKAETKFGLFVEKLFESESVFRTVFPSFYEKIILEETECLVLKDHVAQLKFAEVKDYTIEDIVHQTFESSGMNVMGVDELCSLVKYQVSDVINNNSELVELRACYAHFVDEMDATKRREIILSAVNEHPELFKYSRPMRKVHLHEEVVVVNTAAPQSDTSNL